MNIKFYLLSQEGDTYVGGEGVGVGGMWWEGAGMGLEACGGKGLGWGWRSRCSHHLQPADTPAHFAGHPLNFGLNYRAPIHLFFFFEEPYGLR